MNQLRQNLKYKWVHKLRSFWAKRKLKFLGSDVYIEKNVSLMRYPKNISIKSGVVLKEGAKICSCNKNATVIIGENTTVGYHTYIFSSESISIGDNCLIAPFVYIVDSDHSISKSELINVQANKTSPIVIEDDVWLATNVKVLKGVTIKKGAVVAAGAVVNKDLDGYGIYAGSPVEKIGERK